MRMDTRQFLNEESERVDNIGTVSEDSVTKEEIEKNQSKICATIPEVSPSLEASHPGSRNIDQK